MYTENSRDCLSKFASYANPVCHPLPGTTTIPYPLGAAGLYTSINNASPEKVPKTTLDSAGCARTAPEKRRATTSDRTWQLRRFSMAGDGADEVDGIEDDPRLPVIDYRDSLDVAELAIRRRWRKYTNQIGRKWPNLLLPTRRQFSGPIVFLAQTWWQIARTVVIPNDNGIVI